MHPGFNVRKNGGYSEEECAKASGVTIEDYRRWASGATVETEISAAIVEALKPAQDKK